MISIKSTDIILKEKPGGEIIDENFIKCVYFCGVKIFERKVKYEATLEDKPKSTGYK